MLFRSFSSKDEIFEAVFLKRHPIYTVLPLIMGYRAIDVDDLFRHAAKNMVGVLQTHPEFLNLLLIEIVEFKSQHMNLLLEKIYPEVVGITTLLTPFLDDLRNLSLPQVLRVFISMFFSYFVTQMLLNKFLPNNFSENSLDLFIDIFLNGIKNRTNIQSEKIPFLSGSETI